MSEIHLPFLRHCEHCGQSTPLWKDSVRAARELATDAPIGIRPLLLQMARELDDFRELAAACGRLSRAMAQQSTDTTRIESRAYLEQIRNSLTKVRLPNEREDKGGDYPEHI